MHGKNQRGGKGGWKQTGPHSLCHLALTLMETKQLHTKESVTQRTKESGKQLWPAFLHHSFCSSLCLFLQFTVGCMNIVHVTVQTSDTNFRVFHWKTEEMLYFLKTNAIPHFNVIKRPFLKHCMNKNNSVVILTEHEFIWEVCVRTGILRDVIKRLQKWKLIALTLEWGVRYEIHGTNMHHCALISNSFVLP